MVRRENAKLALLAVAPGSKLLVELEGVVGEGNMVVGVSGRVDVEGSSETAVTVETLALIVALLLWSYWLWVQRAGQAFELLLAITAGARDEHLHLTCV